MSGPSTPAIAKTLVNAPTYLPRSRGGTMSAITTNVMAIIPPLPIPTKARAATRTVMFGATEQKTSPSKNTLIEIWVNFLRPYRSLNFPMRGVAAVDVRR